VGEMKEKAGVQELLRLETPSTFYFPDFLWKQQLGHFCGFCECMKTKHQIEMNIFFYSTAKTQSFEY
jgi:hypothetical protein